MSDAATTPNALDPARPWITDERQLPSRMSWIGAMFNPAGTSPQLHFTRVWTICFFLQLLFVVVPVFMGMVMGLAGGDASAVTTFGFYASPIIFIVTTLISYVNHARRLNDARKPSILAILVLLPLIAGLAISFMGIVAKSAEYDALYAERGVYLEDPDAWRENRLEERRIAQAEAIVAREAAEAEGEDGAEGQRQRGGGRGGPANSGPRADQPLPPQVEFILKPNIPIIQLILIIFNTFLAIWSLMWVARVPNFDKAKQVEDEPFGQAGRAMGAFD